MTLKLMNSTNVTDTDADQPGPGPGVSIIINIPSSARLNNVHPPKYTKYESCNRMPLLKYSPMRRQLTIQMSHSSTPPEF